MTDLRERDDWRGLLPRQPVSTHPGPYVGRGPANYQPTDDRIFEQVCEALADHGGVDASQLHVHVARGEVVLDGDITGAHQHALAVECVRGVRGVRDVRDHLHDLRDHDAP